MTEKLPDKIKELEKKRAVTLEQGVERLLAIDTGEDIQSDLEWLEESSTLLNHVKNIMSGKKSWKLIGAIILFLTCTLIVGGLWAISLPETYVSMKTVSGNVGFTLSENWSLPETFTTDYLRIENFQALHAPELDITFNHQSANAQLEISGKNIVIERLELESNGIIEFDTHSDLLTISIKHSPVNGAFAVKNISRLSTRGIKDAEIKERNFEYPETIEFKGSGESRVPINIIFRINRMANRSQWKFEGMKTERINFLKEVPGGDHLFISTIKQGEVKLYDVPGEEKIYKRDVVTMDHIDLRRLEIACNDDLHVFAEGEVKNLKIGPVGFERDLAPSWLEYIYRNQRFLFFLGAVTSLLSALWGIKETIFK